MGRLRAAPAELGGTNSTEVNEVYGLVNFAHPELVTGEPATRKSRAGFQVRDDALTPGRVRLTPLPADARLDSHGVEALNLQEELDDVGVVEGGFDPGSKEDRLKVGGAILEKVRRRFPGAKVLHVGDTSRVDFGQEDGECTVRDTANASLRGAHVAAHMDKHLPGIAECWGFGGGGGGGPGGGAALGGAGGLEPFEARRAAAGARFFVNMYDSLNGEVWSGAGVSKEEIERTCVRSPAGILNVWVALTPGGVTQHPLAVADARSLVSPSHAPSAQRVETWASPLEPGSKPKRLSGEGSLRRKLGGTSSQPYHLRDAIHGNTVTAKVELSRDFTDTITLLKPEPGGKATWWWRPYMQFGEALMFSTCETPHSAVILEGEDPARRVSAEMRVLVLQQEENGF